MAVRGKPFQPGNNFGKGRPKGSRNKTTRAAQELLNQYAEPVVRTAIATALKGDASVLRAVLDRVVPVRREMPIKIGSLPVATSSDLVKASETVIKKTASGDLTITEGKGVAELIEGHRKVMEMDQLTKRVEALEVRQ